MTRPILAGADGTGSGLDAVAFGARLATAIGSPLVVACVCPEEALAAGAEGESDEPRRQAASILEAARDAVGDLPADFRTVVSTSPARGLAELAEGAGVEAVVVGSTHRGPVGRVMSGSTAERLLHGTGCPVAVAPRGYQRHRSKPIGAIGVAFTDTPEGHEAARVATDLAERGRLPLTVYSVVALHSNWLRPEAVQPDPTVVPEEVRRAYSEPLDRVVAGLPDGVRATGELLFGEVVDELSMAAERDVDLLVCGSRGYGPVRRVLLGTVSSALVRQASVPTLVVPRADDPGSQRPAAHQP
jgi:nucleotide-binding universal stress UspA family protein